MNLRAAALLVVAGLVGVLALSNPPAAAVRDPYGGAGDDDQRAVDLLYRSALAMRRTSYSGTRVLSAWGQQSATTVVVDVDHVAGQGTRLSVRGGGITEETATFLASGGDHSAPAHALTLRSFDLLTDAYAVTLGRRDSVAGRPSTMVEVHRAEALVARLWIDDRSGLLLRREVFDRSGRLVREGAFIDVRITGRGFMAHLPPSAPEPASDSASLPSRRALETAGWECPRQAGTMRLVGIESLDRTGAMHMEYSDGLTRMSVFEQRGSLDPESLRGFRPLRFGGETVYVREGMTTYALWEEDGLVFTAVTDGTLDTVATVLSARPDSARGEGFWDRVLSGLARLGGWASPLV